MERDDLQRLIEIAEENTIEVLNQAYSTNRGIKQLTGELQFIKKLKEELKCEKP